MRLTRSSFRKNTLKQNESEKSKQPQKDETSNEEESEESDTQYSIGTNEESESEEIFVPKRPSRKTYSRRKRKESKLLSAEKGLISDKEDSSKKSNSLSEKVYDLSAEDESDEASKSISEAEPNTKSKLEKDELITIPKKFCCMKCKKSDDDENFLLCDHEEGCQPHGGHFYCFGLKSIPKCDWFCPIHRKKKQGPQKVRPKPKPKKMVPIKKQSEKESKENLHKPAVPLVEPWKLQIIDRIPVAKLDMLIREYVELAAEWSDIESEDIEEEKMFKRIKQRWLRKQEKSLTKDLKAYDRSQDDSTELMHNMIPGTFRATRKPKLYSSREKTVWEAVDFVLMKVLYDPPADGMHWYMQKQVLLPSQIVSWKLCEPPRKECRTKEAVNEKDLKKVSRRRAQSRRKRKDILTPNKRIKRSRLQPMQRKRRWVETKPDDSSHGPFQGEFSSEKRMWNLHEHLQHFIISKDVNIIRDMFRWMYRGHASLKVCDVFLQSPKLLADTVQTMVHIVAENTPDERIPFLLKELILLILKLKPGFLTKYGKIPECIMRNLRKDQTENWSEENRYLINQITAVKERNFSSEFEFPPWNLWNWRCFISGPYGKNSMRLEEKFGVTLRWLSESISDQNKKPQKHLTLKVESLYKDHVDNCIQWLSQLVDNLYVGPDNCVYRKGFDMDLEGWVDSPREQVVRKESKRERQKRRRKEQAKEWRNEMDREKRKHFANPPKRWSRVRKKPKRRKIIRSGGLAKPLDKPKSPYYIITQASESEEIEIEPPENMQTRYSLHSRDFNDSEEISDDIPGYLQKMANYRCNNESGFSITAQRQISRKSEDSCDKVEPVHCKLNSIVKRKYEQSRERYLECEEKIANLVKANSDLQARLKKLKQNQRDLSKRKMSEIVQKEIIRTKFKVKEIMEKITDNEASAKLLEDVKNATLEYRLELLIKAKDKGKDSEYIALESDEYAGPLVMRKRSTRSRRKTHAFGGSDSDFSANTNGTTCSSNIRSRRKLNNVSEEESRPTDAAMFLGRDSSGDDIFCTESPTDGINFCGDMFADETLKMEETTSLNASGENTQSVGEESDSVEIKLKALYAKMSSDIESEPPDVDQKEETFDLSESDRSLDFSESDDEKVCDKRFHTKRDLVDLVEILIQEKYLKKAIRERNGSSRAGKSDLPLFDAEKDEDYAPNESESEPDTVEQYWEQNSADDGSMEHCDDKDAKAKRRAEMRDYLKKLDEGKRPRSKKRRRRRKQVQRIVSSSKIQTIRQVKEKPKIPTRKSMPPPRPTSVQNQPVPRLTHLRRQSPAVFNPVSSQPVSKIGKPALRLPFYSQRRFQKL